MDVCGYVLLLPVQEPNHDSQRIDIKIVDRDINKCCQRIGNKIRKIYDNVKIDNYKPTTDETNKKYAWYEEFMIKAEVNFGPISENEILKFNIIRQFCKENVLSGIGESWMYLNVLEIGHILHHTEPNLVAFALGSIVHMNTFVEHYSSFWSQEDAKCRITQPTVHFQHDVRKLKINFNVAKQKVMQRTAKTHQLHMLELDYNMILRILIEVKENKIMGTNKSIKMVRLYLVMSGAPLIKVHEVKDPDSSSDEEDIDSSKEKNKMDIESNQDMQKHRGNFQKQNASHRGRGKGQTGKDTERCDSSFSLQNDNRQNISQKNVSPRLVDDKMNYSRAFQFGIEGSSAFCSRRVFGMCRVLRLDLQSSSEVDNVWDTVLQLASCCSEAQIFFTSMTQHKLISEFKVPSIKSNFACSYALNTVVSPSYSFIDEIHLKCTLKEAEEKLNTYAKESPEALEKSLFDIQVKHEKGDVVRFMNALDSLYAQNKRYFEETVSRKPLPANVVLLRRALITPTRTVFLPPITHMLSFLLSKTDPDFALRVTIRDDNCDQLTFTITGSKKKKTEFLYNSIGKKLLKGFKIGNRVFEFFGSSTSQLREHGALFYSKDEKGNDADSIRKSLGDLTEIPIVAKYMARMGQSLSQATHSVKLVKEFVKKIPDVNNINCKMFPETEYNRKEYIFSDGIGQMSPEVAEMCYQEKDKDYKPCAIQIRYGGAKGMLLLNPKLKGKKMLLRPSMCKFPSPIDSLQILKTSSPQTAFLNRPFITILEQMGIKKKVFFDLQAKHLRQIIGSLYNSDNAVQLLHEESVLRLPFKRLHQCGVNLAVEPFFRPMILALYSSSIGVLKSKARIKLPFNEARTMFGVMDETCTLNYGQVFVQYTKDMMEGKPSKETIVLEGTVLITKNPCMHPGDVRKFTAVNVKELQHVKDCVVFPQKGPRPHPDEMAGSDLDGDEYCIIWHKPLIFERENEPAMDYSSDVKGEKVEDITVEHMVRFMCNYIRDDYVGLIASAHLARADTEGIFSDVCMELARKYSVTLDFAKTGKPEAMTAKERVHNYPDFMEKFREKDNYLSVKALGHLYRNCKSVELVANALNTEVPVVVNHTILYPGWEQFEGNAQYALMEYIHLFSAPTRLFHLTNEGEIMSGAVKKLEKTFQGKNIEKNIAKMLETVIPYVMKKMKTEFYKEFLRHDLAQPIVSGVGKDQEAQIKLLQDYVFNIFVSASVGLKPTVTPLLEKMLQKVSAWYEAAYRSKKEGSSLFLGLPWVIPELMGILHVVNKSENQILEVKIKSILENKGDLEKFLGVTPSSDQLELSKQVMRKWVKDLGTNLNFDKAVLRGLNVSVDNEMNSVVKSIDPLSVHAEELISKYLRQIIDSSIDVEFDYDIGSKFWEKKKLGILAIVALSTLVSTGKLWEVGEDSAQSPYLLGLKFLTQEFREELRFPLNKGKPLFNRDGTKRHSEFGEIMLRHTSDITEKLQRYSKVGLIKIEFKEPKVGDRWYVLVSIYGKPYNIETLKDAIVQPSFESKIKEAVKNDCCIM